MKIYFYLIISLFFIYNKNFASWNELPYYGGAATDAGISFVLDGELYAGGGLNSKYFASFNPTTSKWTKKADLPGVRAWAMYFTFENKAYIVGGDKDGSFNLSDEIFQFDPTKNSWSKYDNFPGGKRDGGLAFVLNDKIYIGCGFEGQFLKKDMWEYDIKNKSWKQIDDYPIEVIFPTVLNNGDRVFAGLGASQVALNNFYEFNKNSKSWEIKTSFPGGNRQACLDFVYNGRIFLGGGTLDYYENYTDVWEYDINNNRWVKNEELKLPNTNTAWGVSETIGNKLYFGLAADLGNTGYSYKFYSYNMEKVSNIEITNFFGFSSGYIGDTIVKYIPVKNTGQADLIINNIEFENKNNMNFSIENENVNLIIKANSQDSIKVYYHPTKTGFIQEFLLIKSNSDLNSTIKVEVVGKGDVKLPEISLNKNEILFLDTYVNNSEVEEFVITNKGLGILSIDQVYFENDINDEFKIEGQFFPILINPNSEHKIAIIFTPKSVGLKSLNLVIESNDENGLIEIPIKGNAVENTNSVVLHNPIKYFPNPTSNNMNFELTLDEASIVKIEVYNMNGLKVNEIINEYLNNGKHNFEWNCNSVSNGMYNLRITINGQSTLKSIGVIN